MHTIVVGALGALAATGCVDNTADTDPSDLPSAPSVQLHATPSAATVQSYVSPAGCSTAVVIGLSKQIAEEANCEHPGHFVSFAQGGGITFTSSAVLPYIQQGAKDDLKLVAASASLQINSGLRTVAQQYLLYEWYLAGECGITAAATPGTSNHEGGRAVDLENWSTRISQMAAHGWAHDVPGDDVHFDHTSSPTDLGEDVHAFQVLWNLNHPTDTIGEDGDYGPETEARLQKSPATGFAMGPTCTGSGSGSSAAPTFASDVVSIDGPDTAAPQVRVKYAITLNNTGTADWPASTALQLASGSASPLYDSSWQSETVIATLGAKVTAGSQVTITFDVTTPAETASTPISQPLALVDGTTTIGTIDLAVTIVPGQAGPTSSDGGDGADVTGGCNGGGAGAGGATGAAAIALAIAFAARRRRAR